MFFVLYDGNKSFISYYKSLNMLLFEFINVCALILRNRISVCLYHLAEDEMIATILHALHRSESSADTDADARHTYSTLTSASSPLPSSGTNFEKIFPCKRALLSPKKCCLVFVTFRKKPS